jgi:hypothetical protein
MGIMTCISAGLWETEIKSTEQSNMVSSKSWAAILLYLGKRARIWPTRNAVSLCFLMGIPYEVRSHWYRSMELATIQQVLLKIDKLYEHCLLHTNSNRNFPFLIYNSTYESQNNLIFKKFRLILWEEQITQVTLPYIRDTGRHPWKLTSKERRSRLLRRVKQQISHQNHKSYLQSVHGWSQGQDELTSPSWNVKFDVDGVPRWSSSARPLDDIQSQA